MPENESEKQQITPEMEELIKKKTIEVIKQGRQKENALFIFILGLVGCGAPIVAIYGLIYLLIHREVFQRKTLAIIGTIIAWLWTILFTMWLIFSKTHSF